MMINCELAVNQKFTAFFLLNEGKQYNFCRKKCTFVENFSDGQENGDNCYWNYDFSSDWSAYCFL